MEYRQSPLWKQYGQLPDPQAVEGKNSPDLWRTGGQLQVFEQRDGAGAAAAGSGTGPGRVSGRLRTAPERRPGGLRTRFRVVSGPFPALPRKLPGVPRTFPGAAQVLPGRSRGRSPGAAQVPPGAAQAIPGCSPGNEKGARGLLLRVPRAPFRRGTERLPTAVRQPFLMRLVSSVTWL